MSVISYLAFILFIGSCASVGAPCPLRSCPSSQTCCGLVSVGYGCCPKYANATCCADNIHCCPADYSCDIEAKTCKPITVKGKRAIDMPLVKNIVHSLTKENVEESCKDKCENFTCCGIGNGQTGCCPHENGVCCNDNAHCCQENYICNVSRRIFQCIRKNTTMLSSLPPVIMKASKLVRH